MVHLIATTTFGLEATVKRELSRLGITKIKAQDGRIDFSGDMSLIPKANIWLRSSDRVLLCIGEFEASTFDELFEKTKSLPWEQWITEKGKFTVIGKSVKSKLFSVPDCQSIVKKAVVERLKSKYNVSWFEESAEEYEIQVSILRDVATLTIDTSGAGLHKRGYRETAGVAPLKETLAAALIDLSYWRKDRYLIDPFCGSGTIPIEAALIAKNIAPGLKRSFASESWPIVGRKLWNDARTEAADKIDNTTKIEIEGSDIDPKAIQLAQQNAEKAGVGECIRFKAMPFEQFKADKQYGIMITNPPYGERIGEQIEVENIYRDMGYTFSENKTWSVYVITSNEDFEEIYGRRADQKRKLYNGRIKIDYYQFFGERPPRN